VGDGSFLVAQGLDMWRKSPWGLLLSATGQKIGSPEFTTKRDAVEFADRLKSLTVDGGLFDWASPGLAERLTLLPVGTVRDLQRQTLTEAAARPRKARTMEARNPRATAADARFPDTEAVRAHLRRLAADPDPQWNRPRSFLADLAERPDIEI